MKKILIWYKLKKEEKIIPRKEESDKFMDRQLLSKILAQMRKNLKEGKVIGDMKVGALLALGSQLEALHYYIGHELGTTLKVKQVKDIFQIPSELKDIISQFNIGDIEITKSSDEIVELKMKDHGRV